MPAHPAHSGRDVPAWQVWAALLIVYFVWGSTYLGIRVVVETMPPFLAAGIRFVAAGAVLVLILAVRHGPGGPQAHAARAGQRRAHRPAAALHRQRRRVPRRAERAVGPGRARGRGDPADGAAHPALHGRARAGQRPRRRHGRLRRAWRARGPGRPGRFRERLRDDRARVRLADLVDRVVPVAPHPAAARPARLDRVPAPRPAA